MDKACSAKNWRSFGAMLRENRQPDLAHILRMPCGMKGKDIKRALRAKGLTPYDLADAIGASYWSASRLLNERRTISREEGIAIEALLSRKLNETPERVGVLRVPVFGLATAAGGERVSMNEGDYVEWIEAPITSESAENKAPFRAVRVLGAAMEPRLFQGEAVIFQLGVSPARGQDCVVEFKSNEALVKTYEGLRDGVLFLRQWNPEGEVRVPWDQVRAVHAVRWRA